MSLNRSVKGFLPWKPILKLSRSENAELKLKLDAIEQNSRRTLVRFNGIPERGPDDNTTELVLDIANKAKLDLKPDDIEQDWTRQQNKIRQVIVRLIRHNLKKTTSFKYLE